MQFSGTAGNGSKLIFLCINRFFFFRIITKELTIRINIVEQLVADTYCQSVVSLFLSSQFLLLFCFLPLTFSSCSSNNSSPQIYTRKAYGEGTMTKTCASNEVPCNSSSQKMLARIQKGTCIYHIFFVTVFSGKGVNRGTISIATENTVLSQLLNLFAQLSHTLSEI